jgi:hypothetical protein
LISRDYSEPSRLTANWDPSNPQDCEYAVKQFSIRHAALEHIKRDLDRCCCPQNPSIHATYCRGCRRGERGHFNRKEMRDKVERLQIEVAELQNFLRKSKQ